jgi:hypothetical protein
VVGLGGGRPPGRPEEGAIIEKRILVPGRLRRPPKKGFSWVDRRFLREHAERLSHDAVLLYLFLAAVSDRHGISFYKDSTMAGMLRATAARVASAREELVFGDLVAFDPPLTQVLSLPAAGTRAASAGLDEVSGILGALVARHRDGE